MSRATKFFEETFAIANAETLTYNVDPYLSLDRFRTITAVLKVTEAVSGADDELDVWIEESWDGGSTFNERLRFRAVLGNETEPIEFVGIMTAEPPFGTEEMHQSGTLPKGTILNGPFPRRAYSTSNRDYAAVWRVQLDLTVTGTANYAGTITLYGQE